MFIGVYPLLKYVFLSY